MTAEREFRSRWFATVGPARVLDVGAGPLSSLGTHVPGRDVEIIAVDPLADIYDELAAGI